MTKKQMEELISRETAVLRRMVEVSGDALDAETREKLERAMDAWDERGISSLQ